MIWDRRTLVVVRSDNRRLSDILLPGIPWLIWEIVNMPRDEEVGRQVLSNPRGSISSPDCESRRGGGP
jgi:hypothetical protein